jgi:multidrug efflux pump
VATSLLALGVILAGAVSYFLLPVSPLPEVDFPTISVQASLPGASPDTMAATVATPLERALGRIADVTEMTSSSSQGSTRVTLQFGLNRDINGAARDVQAAINAARSLLPSGMPSNPTYRKVNPADAPIMIMALTSNVVGKAKMYDAASTVLAQKLAQVEGIGQVTVGGGSLPAVRVELNPNALNHYGIGLEGVRTALSAANANKAKGALENGEHRWQIYGNDQANRAIDYQPLIIAYKNGSVVRLRDVAEVTDSVTDIRNAGMANGVPAVLIIMFKQPGANVISTVDRVNALLPALRAALGKDIELSIMMDRTPTIRRALHDVEMSLLISIALVIGVVFVFLRSGRATLIPSVAVPVSLLGTFAVMYLGGFSLDNLSLMALTVATGFVVDDAIVVLENISRHIENGMKPFEAALKGAAEVGFTVLSMSLSLVAVFLPILLMGGIVGRLFREFAVVLSAAIGVSLLVSLTVTPMMCSRLLKNEKKRKHGRIYRASERVFNAMQQGYSRTLHWALDNGPLVLMVLLATIALNVYLYIIVPKGFFPSQDTGRIMGNIRGDQSISFQAMSQKLSDFMRIVRENPAVENVVGFTGGGQRNSGNMFISLKPLSERKASADEVINQLRGKLEKEPGARLTLQSSQDIRVGGRSGGASYQYTLQDDDLAELRAWAPKVSAAMQKMPELADVNSDQQDGGLQTSLIFNRDVMSRLGLSPSQVDSVLNDAFGQRQVSTIYNPLNQYHVVMEVAPQYWQSPADLKNTYVTVSNTLIPLSAFSSYASTKTPLAVNHQGQFAATTISFNLAEGTSLEGATKAINEMFGKIGAPTSLHGSFQGTAKAFQESLDSEPVLILAALVTIYIVLGMLYESYIHPITILSTLPSAGVGALLALLAFKIDFTIIALIGVILLIGIVKKNAIMMIDFAIAAERDEGLDSKGAIFKACQLRFRPIMMTTMAALLGALPLALGTGNGAEFRQPLGISIVGGLIVSQLLTLYTTPVVYLYFDHLHLWWQRRRSKNQAARLARNPV